MEQSKDILSYRKKISKSDVLKLQVKSKQNGVADKAIAKNAAVNDNDKNNRKSSVANRKACKNSSNSSHLDLLRKGDHVVKRDARNKNTKCNQDITDKKLRSDTTLKNKKDQSMDMNYSEVVSNGEKTLDYKKNFKSKVKKSSIKDVKFSEDNVSFEDIEKKIFENIPGTSKKSNYASKNLNNSASKIIKKNVVKKPSSSSKRKNAVIEQYKDSLQSKSKKVETTFGKRNKKIPKTDSTANTVKKNKTKYTESSSDEGDWEDVDELSELLKRKDTKVTENVQIELEAENVLWGIKKRRRRTQQELIQDYLRREINKTIREVHENMHKTHLLCLLAHGMYLNSILCSETLTCCALSVIPQHYYSPKRLDISHLEKFVNWFYSHFKIKSNKPQEMSENTALLSFEATLITRFDMTSPVTIKELVLMFVATCRSIGMTARYVQNLLPLSWKPSSTSLLKPQKIDENPEEKPQKSENKNVFEENLQSSENTQKRCENKKKSKKILSSEETKSKSKIIKQKKNLKLGSSDEEYDSNEDEDFKLPIKFKEKRKSSSKRKSNVSKRRKSEEIKSEDNRNIKKEVFQYWAEVFVEEEERWIPVDISTNKIHCAAEIEAKTSNLAYVVAFNPDQTVKDVTKRYMSSWLSFKDKVRCDGTWWASSLKPFTPALNRRERNEDKEMEKCLEQQPLPKTISEYKNHPLYALQRHLLKFEAIYPPDTSPVGFMRGEPVFPRESVKTLYGRENWIKEAKTVIVGEEPYKIVKARPKWDRSTCQIIKDRPLDVFGEWQVEDYDPPTAKNGRVPRNEYGNVDLFKPCMLPKGCVHMRINGLSRVARKLDIDCAPAVTGFDFHSGSCHAVHDGFIVCEEHKEILVDAWNQDQFEQAKKEEEKRIKRIYDNWKKLITGITLKDRLKEKYGVTGEEELPSQVGASSTSKVQQIKKKIKQEDLDSLPSNTFTHSVTNIKIDFGSSVTDALRKKPKKTFTRPGNCKAKSNTKDKEKFRENLSSHSSDSEMSEGEKKRKIRSILDWNPTTRTTGSDPILSDDSDSDGGTSKHLKNSSLMLTPISESSSAGGKTKNVSRSLTKSLKTKRKLVTDKSLSSESENGEAIVPAPKRHSFRSKNVKNINYNDDDGSSSDISVEDSDTGDATYCPAD